MKKEIIIALIIGLAILGYGFLNYQTKSLQERNEVAKDTLYRSLLLACRENVYEAYTKDWNNACELKGKENSCSLPGRAAEYLNEQKADQETNCIKMYAK